MVRHYICRKPPPTDSKHELSVATHAVKTGILTLYRASKIYIIPKATIFVHVKGTRGAKSNTGGRAPGLPFDVEQKVAECIKNSQKMGPGSYKERSISYDWMICERKQDCNTFTKCNSR